MVSSMEDKNNADKGRFQRRVGRAGGATPSIRDHLVDTGSPYGGAREIRKRNVRLNPFLGESFIAPGSSSRGAGSAI